MLQWNTQLNFYALLPLIQQVRRISLDIMVTYLVCIAERLVSLNRSMRYTLVASCNAMMVTLWVLISVGSGANHCKISWTNLLKGSFMINSSMDFWYLLISQSTTVPKWNWLDILMPPILADVRYTAPLPVQLDPVCAAAVTLFNFLLACLAISCFWGHFPFPIFSPRVLLAKVFLFTFWVIFILVPPMKWSKSLELKEFLEIWVGSLPKEPLLLKPLLYLVWCRTKCISNIRG